MTLSAAMPFRHNTPDTPRERSNCAHQRDVRKDVHCSFTQSNYTLQSTQRPSNSCVSYQAVRPPSAEGRSAAEDSARSRISTRGDVGQSPRKHTPSKGPRHKREHAACLLRWEALTRQQQRQGSQAAKVPGRGRQCWLHGGHVCPCSVSCARRRCASGCVQILPPHMAFPGKNVSSLADSISRR